MALNIMSKFTVKPLLIAIAVLFVLLVAQSIRLRISHSSLTVAEAERDTATTQLKGANEKAAAQEQSAKDWKQTAFNTRERLIAANKENQRLAAANEAALESVQQRNARLAEELRKTKTKYDKLRSIPECQRFMEIPLCPEIRSAASSPSSP